MNIAVTPIRSSRSCDVAIIGAGPYGLAAAAHLRAAGIATRVFGEPMAFWRHNMPDGMKLRSPWIATHIAEPRHRFTLDDYYSEADMQRPTVAARGKLHRLRPLVSKPRGAGYRHAGCRCASLLPPTAVSDHAERWRKRLRQASDHGNRVARPRIPAGDNSTVCRAQLVCHSCEHTDSTALPRPPRRRDRSRPERLRGGGAAA